MKNDTTKESKKTPTALLNPLITIFSVINTGVLIILKLIYITSQQIGMIGITLGNIGTGVFFSSVSLISSMYSFFDCFREKSLYKKCNYKRTLEEKRRDKYRIQGICLDILCDTLFLTGATVSIALFSNPIVLFVTAPLVTLGCIVMIGNIINSIYHQVKNFKIHLSQLSKEEQEELYTEMKKEINLSRLYRIASKVLPDIVILAKLHTNQENKERREKVQNLKDMLKEGNQKPIDGDTSDKVIEMKKEKHIEQKSYNSKVPTNLSLDQDVIKGKSNTTRSL
ncbi:MULTISPECIES: hypothetical protein [unclassified Wolbachia]|uniref:hypothetical protein n=1 Tax=unclassified Wolbachia TaxID=2640676 RepID=UPI0015D09BFA|nr:MULTISPECIES: hypothetical protein [unclassified Wolbachia]